MSARMGVIVFPGSNSDRDSASAWEELGLGSAQMLWHGDTDLKGVDAIFVPGGFSYGDALRAGAIARFAPIMESVAGFAAEGGLVLGVCNGFQILCEAGLLPGALTRNEGLRFVCHAAALRVETDRTPFTTGYTPGQIVSMPIAHGEGRFVCDDDTYTRLVDEDRIVFRYADAASPNGSRDRIAGIVGGPRRNILGMMPHPERAAFERLGSADGSTLLRSLHQALTQSPTLASV